MDYVVIHATEEKDRYGHACWQIPHILGVEPVDRPAAAAVLKAHLADVSCAPCQGWLAWRNGQRSA